MRIQVTEPGKKTIKISLPTALIFNSFFTAIGIKAVQKSHKYYGLDLNPDDAAEMVRAIAKWVRASAKWVRKNGSFEIVSVDTGDGVQVRITL